MPASAGCVLRRPDRTVKVRRATPYSTSGAPRVPARSPTAPKESPMKRLVRALLFWGAASCGSGADLSRASLDPNGLDHMSRDDSPLAGETAASATRADGSRPPDAATATDRALRDDRADVATDG